MIESERLIFRGAKEEDIDYIMGLENHKANRDYVWQGTREEHLREIEDQEHILSVIYSKKDQARLGYFLAHVDLRLNIFELRRIVIEKKGQGYGREAMEAIMAYAFKELNTNRFWLDVYPENRLGISLYEKLGLTREGVLRQNYRDHRGYLDQIIYSILREEYPFCD